MTTCCTHAHAWCHADSCCAQHMLTAIARTLAASRRLGRASAWSWSWVMSEWRHDSWLLCTLKLEATQLQPQLQLMNYSYTTRLLAATFAHDYMTIWLMRICMYVWPWHCLPWCYTSTNIHYDCYDSVTVAVAVTMTFEVRIARTPHRCTRTYTHMHSMHRALCTTSL